MTTKTFILIYLFIGILMMMFNVYLLVNKSDGWFDENNKSLNYNKLSPLRQFVVQGLMILLWGPFVFFNILNFLKLFAKLIIVYIKHLYYNVVLWYMIKREIKDNKKIESLLKNILKEKKYENK